MFKAFKDFQPKLNWIIGESAMLAFFFLGGIIGYLFRYIIDSKIFAIICLVISIVIILPLVNIVREFLNKSNNHSVIYLDTYLFQTLSILWLFLAGFSCFLFGIFVVYFMPFNYYTLLALLILFLATSSLLFFHIKNNVLDKKQ